MPRFGSDSREALDSCDYRLVQIAERAIQVFDFSVLEGHRDKETQNRYFEEGKSKLRWPDGNHNKLPSRAMDLAPYPIDWSGHPKAIGRFYLLAGVILAVADGLGVDLRWGGAWKLSDLSRISTEDLKANTFDDLGHFELSKDEE